MTPKLLETIIQKQLQGTISEEEWMQLEAFVRNNDNREAVTSALGNLMAAQQPDDRYDHQGFDHLLHHVLQADRPAIAVVPMRRRRYAWIAAAAILVLALGAVWLFAPWKAKPAGVVATIPVHDALPGQEGAVLTLANGQRILIDSAKTGIVEVPGMKATIRDGVLVYESMPAVQAPAGWNTMATPRGRQFQVVLPDGTHAWLNAASSIRYPVRFQGNSRTVQVTGEVYFEVTKNTTQPFLVQLANAGGKDAGTVEVLGTHFNVNAHEDMPGIVTTLLEGSVKVSGEKGHTVLKPGEQVILKDAAVGNKHKADLEAVMAWKEGKFYFDNTPVQQVMGQLQRWYDVAVVYEGNKVPAGAFSGDFPRTFLLSEVLRILELSGIQYKIENKKLIVSAK